MPYLAPNVVLLAVPVELGKDVYAGKGKVAENTVKSLDIHKGDTVYFHSARRIKHVGWVVRACDVLAIEWAEGEQDGQART